MSKNPDFDNTEYYGKYTNISQFKSQFTGKWSPSDDLWTAIDFTYGKNGYRMDTGRMYGNEPIKTKDGGKAVFYIYNKRDKYETIDDNEKLLKSDSLIKIIDELNSNEEDIIGTIKFYNDTVVDYNKLISSFPYNVVALFCRYKKKDFYNNEKREIYEILNER